jgi:hypothetical protein
MNKIILTLIVGASSVFVMTGCYGRPKMQVNSSQVAHAASLQPGQAAVITFGALWCHPCREEIDSMNEASHEFAGIIQFRGFLVEGEEKGSVVDPGDLADFTSFTGQSAQYAMRMDPSWQLFDSLHAPQGRSLPTMVIINQSGEVTEVIQQSLDYQSQLRPLLLALARGQSTIPVNPSNGGGENKPGQKQITDSVANWQARSEVAANLALVSNVTAAWHSGLQQYAFTAAEMPFASGQITFEWDGASQDTPQTAKWISDTAVSLCTLNLVFKSDGTLLTSSGNCRQK